MKTNRIAFTVIILTAFVAFAASMLKIQLVHAQTEASSTDATTTETATASTPELGSTTTPSDTPAQPDDAASIAPPSPPPSSFKLVRIAGKRYIDYFIDGTTTVSFPGDPDIDANLDKPDAPTPTHGELKWDHTISVDGYDTATGELGVNEYAQLSDGSYVVHYPASTYTDATSTAEFSDRIVTIDVDPTVPPRKSISTELATSTSPDASTTTDNATTTQ